MQLSVLCSEDSSRVAPDELARETAEVRLRFASDRQSARCLRDVAEGARSHADYYQPVVSDVPTLVLSGDVDPVTPPAWGALGREASVSRHAHHRARPPATASSARHAAIGLVNDFIERGTAEGLRHRVRQIRPPAAVLRRRQPDPIRRATATAFAAMMPKRCCVTDARKRFGSGDRGGRRELRRRRTARSPACSVRTAPARPRRCRMLYAVMKPDSRHGARGRRRCRRGAAGGAGTARRAARRIRPVSAADCARAPRLLRRTAGHRSARRCAARTDELLDLLDMRAIADRRTAGFSHGERTKVALARALVHDPQNVLLDEPTNGLDVMSTRAVRTIVRRLRDEGRCVLFSSHVMQEVSALCDSIVVIAAGRVVAHGTPDELRAADRLREPRGCVRRARRARARRTRVRSMRARTQACHRRPEGAERLAAGSARALVDRVQRRHRSGADRVHDEPHRRPAARSRERAHSGRRA